MVVKDISLKRQWAHLWAFGCDRISFSKEGIHFEFKIPKYNKNEVIGEFIHCWKDPINFKTFIQAGSDLSIRIFERHLTLMAWDKGIFTPSHPKPTEEELEQVEKSFKKIESIFKKIGGKPEKW